MKFIVMLICIALIIAFTTSAQPKNGLYHHRSSFLSSTHWFVIIDNDTAYVNWVAEHHWVKCGPIDTLYRQEDGSYSTNDKVVSIKDDILYRCIENERKKKKVTIRLKKAGRSSIRTWNRMYTSIKESGKVKEHWANAAHELYLRYASIIKE